MFKIIKYETGNMVQVAGCLPGKHKFLTLNSSTAD
jgi:hypothetical protein